LTLHHNHRVNRSTRSDRSVLYVTVLHSRTSSAPHIFKHVVFKHRARPQRVLHPRTYIPPSRLTRLSPAPLHPLHQRPTTLTSSSRLRPLLILLLRQRRMPLRADPSRPSRRISGPHRVLAGILPQRAFRTFPQRYTWAPRNAGGEMACDAENGREGEGGEYPGWRG
jgi:hypothetical protein